MKKILFFSLLAISINCTTAQNTELNIGDKAPELAYENPKGEIFKTF